MRVVALSTAASLAMVVLATHALAQSCYDLWYQRNEIYDRNGY